ncbi:HNH endonuclease [Cotonvirus japonicus]|uniref:HNH endonuclease n=1 Tax=Cotonvirus japonicus TaxID=2811091 RepID=A0ABM7NS42_9VIRU|nr:HNH endonuclease [Cotonvirus japonicus]BCS82974.1 HNH endonuclease [Cotonvirus japonicus]
MGKNYEFIFDEAGSHDEEFEYIPGYGKKYSVSNKGYIYSEKSNTILVPTKHHSGYFNVKITDKNNNRKFFYVHQLVAMAFALEKPKKGSYKGRLVVDHIDGDKTNNNLDNLRYVCDSVNISNAHINNKNYHGFGKKLQKKINQYDFRGNFIKSYDSLTKAAKITEIPMTSISACCLGRMSLAGNFIWKYEKSPEVKLFEGEIFKPIKKINGFSYPNYIISNYGRVKNIRTGKMLAMFKDGNTYSRIQLYTNKKIRKIYKIHRLVAIHFLKKPDDKSKDNVHHIDEDKQNNYYKNLQWVTSRENTTFSLGKKIQQIDIKTNKIINEFPSISQAAESIGIDKKGTSNIGVCCKGKIKKAYGFKWKFVSS